MKISRFLFPLIILLLASNCTLIGFYSGIKEEMKSYSNIPVDFDSLKNISPDGNIRIILKSGKIYTGTSLSVIDNDSEKTSDSKRDTLHTQPKPSRSIVLQQNSSKKVFLSKTSISRIETYEPIRWSLIGALVGFGLDYLMFLQSKKNFEWGDPNG